MFKYYSFVTDSHLVILAKYCVANLQRNKKAI